MTITINDYTELFAGDSLGGDLASDPVNLYKVESYAVQVIWTGTPVGDFKLQASCDQGEDEIGTGVTNWDDISGAVQAAGGAAGSVIINNTLTPGYNWLRLIYDRTSSTGTVSAKFNGKG